MGEFYVCVYVCMYFYLLFLIKILFIYFQRERVREGKREGEKHQRVVAFCMPPTGDLACNSGLCPDWELNLRPFGFQAGIQSTASQRPGLTGEF